MCQSLDRVFPIIVEEGEDTGEPEFWFAIKLVRSPRKQPSQTLFRRFVEPVTSDPLDDVVVPTTIVAPLASRPLVVLHKILLEVVII